jgi:phosphopantetheinyl transferase (holo-ACP synthase)
MAQEICIGVDCQDLEVFKKADLRTNPTFYSRIFTKREIEYCISRALPS